MPKKKKVEDPLSESREATDIAREMLEQNNQSQKKIDPKRKLVDDVIDSLSPKFQVMTRVILFAVVASIAHYISCRIFGPDFWSIDVQSNEDESVASKITKRFTFFFERELRS